MLCPSSAVITISILVVFLGSVNLSEGNNVIVVSVTSQDNTKTIRHTINIKKNSSVTSSIASYYNVSFIMSWSRINCYAIYTFIINICVCFSSCCSLDVTATSTSDSASINNNGNSYTGTIANLGFSNNVHTLTVSPEDTNATKS